MHLVIGNFGSWLCAYGAGSHPARHVAPCTRAAGRRRRDTRKYNAIAAICCRLRRRLGRADAELATCALGAWGAAEDPRCDRRYDRGRWSSAPRPRAAGRRRQGRSARRIGRKWCGRRSAMRSRPPSLTASGSAMEQRRPCFACCGMAPSARDCRAHRLAAWRAGAAKSAFACGSDYAFVVTAARARA
jgi:hypothetical protein